MVKDGGAIVWLWFEWLSKCSYVMTLLLSVEVLRSVGNLRGSLEEINDDNMEWVLARVDCCKVSHSI